MTHPGGDAVLVLKVIVEEGHHHAPGKAARESLKGDEKRGKALMAPLGGERKKALPLPSSEQPMTLLSHLDDEEPHLPTPQHTSPHLTTPPHTWMMRSQLDGTLISTLILAQEILSL